MKLVRVSVMNDYFQYSLSVKICRISVISVRLRLFDGTQMTLMVQMRTICKLDETHLRQCIQNSLSVIISRISVVSVLFQAHIDRSDPKR